MAAGLGIPDARLDQPISTLSGGQRRRVELARILFAGSDVLCLDEPTNHLDVDAKDWLMGFLRQYKGALLVISHDLALLDESITRVLHLDRPTETSVGEVIEYRGTYSQYQRSRAEDEARRTKKAALQAKEIDRLQTVVDRFGAKATKATMAHSIEKRIARLETDRVDAPTCHQDVQRPVPSPSAVRRDRDRGEGSVQGVRRARRSSRTSASTSGAVSGSSSSASTARARRACCASSRARPTPISATSSSATRSTPGTTRRNTTTCGPSESLLANIRDAVPAGRRTSPRPNCAACSACSGCPATRCSRTPGTLSGGEKTKLALAMLMVGRNNLLLLDEPTNNLDPPSRDAVASALVDWPGAIILVSHDEEFVRELAPTKVLLMPDGDVDYFSEDWLDLVSIA